MKTFNLAILFVLISLTSMAENKTQVFNLSVTEEGFQPKTINAKPGTPVTLNVTRKTDKTCATEIQIPFKKIRRELPLNQTVVIEIGKLKKGEIHFGCGMNMMEAAVIQVK